jgi:hypothetical protein
MTASPPPADALPLEEPEITAAQIPEDIREPFAAKPRGRAEAEGIFAPYLWHLLNWVGDDLTLQANVGCGWESDTVFFLEKRRFCAVFQVAMNTLNLKLRERKFDLARHPHHSVCSCRDFTRTATIDDLKRIDARRRAGDAPPVTPRVLLIPLLDSVRLFSFVFFDLDKFKLGYVIPAWTEICRETIWAIDKSLFVVRAAEKFATSLQQHEYDSQQTEFGQWLAQTGSDINEVAKLMINYVLVHDQQGIVTILDFARFLTRFGPEDCLLDKIHQLLRCSSVFGDVFRPKVQASDDGNRPLISYSNTYPNCFVLKKPPGISYHVYNAPLGPTKTGFLFDETGKWFLAWQPVFDQFFAKQSVPFYGDEYPFGPVL